MRRHVVAALLVLQATTSLGAPPAFHWDWHQIQSLYSEPLLKDAKMDDSERSALAEAIEGQIGKPDPADPEMASEEQVKRVVLSANIKTIRLSQDESASPQVVAQIEHYCSPTGNCTMWFFQRTPRGFALLLEADGQGFTIQQTATNGFKELVVNMHGSATLQELRVYRYAHERYSQVACYDANWAPLENGVVHELKEPRCSAPR